MYYLSTNIKRCIIYSSHNVGLIPIPCLQESSFLEATVILFQYLDAELPHETEPESTPSRLCWPVANQCSPGLGSWFQFGKSLKEISPWKYFCRGRNKEHQLREGGVNVFWIYLLIFSRFKNIFFRHFPIFRIFQQFLLQALQCRATVQARKMPLSLDQYKSLSSTLHISWTTCK